MLGFLALRRVWAVAPKPRFTPHSLHAQNIPSVEPSKEVFGAKGVNYQCKILRGLIYTYDYSLFHVDIYMGAFLAGKVDPI